jgi:hypothetical protein
MWNNYIGRYNSVMFSPSSFGLFWLFTLLSVGVTSASPVNPQLEITSVSERDVVTVKRVAEAWISLIDRQEYDESWDRTAEVFRSRVKKEQWIEDLETNRKPLGKVRSRKLLTAIYVSDLPDSPRGEYALLDYEVAFETDAGIHEIIIPYLAGDGEWRVAGYSLK